MMQGFALRSPQRVLNKRELKTELEQKKEQPAR
jgi:hypothetical protein